MFSLLLNDIAISDTTAYVLQGIMFLIMIPFYILAGAFMVFAFMWVFRFQQLRQWFNKKAGMAVVPKSRADKRLLKKGLFLYLGCAFYLVPGIIYARIEYKKSVEKRGALATKWRAIYVAMMTLTLAILCALLCWLIVILLLVGAMGKVYDFAFHEQPDKKGQYIRCCDYCGRQGSCMASGDWLKEDRTTYYCSDYVPIY